MRERERESESEREREREKERARERERERERCRAGRQSNSIKNRCFNDFETCESIRIVRRQNRDSYE